jgi:endoglucanase
MLPPLFRHGRYIIDSNNQEVRLKCVNWYGGHQEPRTPGGLNHQPVITIVQSVVAAHFNCIQLTFSTQMVLEGDLPNLDEIVSVSTAANLAVIMNSHTNAASWCCGVADGNGVWNSKNYSTDDWLQSLAIVAERYRNNSMVVGIDVKNEVHNTLDTTVTWGQ